MDGEWGSASVQVTLVKRLVRLGVYRERVDYPSSVSIRYGYGAMGEVKRLRHGATVCGAATHNHGTTQVRNRNGIDRGWFGSRSRYWRVFKC